MVESGVEVLVVLNGLLYYCDKFDWCMNYMVVCVVENDVLMVYVNIVGGQDDCVFDGVLFVLNCGGKLVMQLFIFVEVLVYVDFDWVDGEWIVWDGDKVVLFSVWESDYYVMVLLLCDYMGKIGFKKVLLGLFGGIDSVLVVIIVVDVLGVENVCCVMLLFEYIS